MHIVDAIDQSTIVLCKNEGDNYSKSKNNNNKKLGKDIEEMGSGVSSVTIKDAILNGEVEALTKNIRELMDDPEFPPNNDSIGNVTLDCNSLSPSIFTPSSIYSHHIFFTHPPFSIHDKKRQTFGYNAYNFA